MSIDSVQRTGTAPSRLTVPWSTVLPLAVVMAYADGFWMITLRGAVGAMNRTQQPFASWWRQSTLFIPVFVLAVLAALTLALRLFGPALRQRGKVAVTALLVVAAGTVAGIGLIVANSFYDYHLQSAELQMMDSMHSLCVRSCLALQQQATLEAHIRGIGYTSGLMLATNLVLVGWVLAMLGGRLKVIGVRQHPGAIESPQQAGSSTNDLRLLLVAGLLGTAAIHAAVVPDHLIEWPAGGVFFILLAAGEVVVAGVMFAMARLRRAVLIAAAAVSIGPLVLWVYSRTAGLPLGPGKGLPEAIGLADSVAGVLEVGALIAAFVLLRATKRAWRPAVSAHTRGLRLVAVIVISVVGLAGAVPTWLDDSGPQTVLSVSH